jgi:hypothetical protein
MAMVAMGVPPERLLAARVLLAQGADARLFRVGTPLGGILRSRAIGR